MTYPVAHRNGPAPEADDAGEAGWNPRRHFLIGAFALAMLVGGVGGWAAWATIAGAVIATGSIEVEGNRQVVQHPEGGVITEIRARDGDRVEAGDVVVRLDGEKLRTELAVVEGQYLEFLARRGRLVAERDGLDSVQVEPELLLAAASGDTAAAALVVAQEQQFDVRREAIAEESAGRGERRQQIGRLIEGLESERAAAGRQIELVRTGLEGQEALLAQGLTRRAEVLEPQRELARLEGQAGQIEAAIAENRAKLAEIEIEAARLALERRQEAIVELRELEFREIEVREQRMALREEVARLELRAPATGRIYGSTAETVRGVIAPGQAVMYVVPQGAPLFARTNVETVAIDQVREGQEAVIRLPAFNQRTTPEFIGHVKRISADSLEDETTGMSFYRVDIELPEAATGTLALQPGMPVEAFIRTEDRTPISYLMKPFTDYITKAFRES